QQQQQALRLVLPDTEEVGDEELGVLFMKIDANGSGGVDWGEFTGFLLQARERNGHKTLSLNSFISALSINTYLDEGNRNMAAAAHMVDLRPLSGRALSQRTGVINVERPGVSAYVTCSRDGTIRFWHKGTLKHLRTISHLDTIKTSYEPLVKGAKNGDTERGARRISSTPIRRAVQSMKSAWVSDIQQMPLSSRIVAACLDRTVNFYDFLTGEFVCRIAGLASPPTCVDCIQVDSSEQQVIFGDLNGLLHVWNFGKHFYIPG
ncbi:unnamed protein product, partial [Laminaria digitata]